MSLWGGSSADESKPKFLVRGSAVAEPDNCIATEQGWVYRHYQNDAKTVYYDEVLIAGSFGGDGGDAGAGSSSSTSSVAKGKRPMKQQQLSLGKKSKADE